MPQENKPEAPKPESGRPHVKITGLDVPSGLLPDHEGCAFVWQVYVGGQEPHTYAAELRLGSESIMLGFSLPSVTDAEKESEKRTGFSPRFCPVFVAPAGQVIIRLFCSTCGVPIVGIDRNSSARRPSIAPGEPDWLAIAGHLADAEAALKTV